MLAYALYAFRLAPDRTWADIALPAAFIVAFPTLWCWPSALVVVALGFLGDSGRLGLDAAPFALRIDEVTPLAGRPGRAVLVGRVLAGSVTLGEVVSVQCGDEEFCATLEGLETISPASDQNGPRTALIVRGLRRGLPARGDWVHDDRDPLRLEELDALLAQDQRRRHPPSQPHLSGQTAIHRRDVERIKVAPN
jgi:translation elongation factor EF-Tu-like GTPase